MGMNKIPRFFLLFLAFLSPGRSLAEDKPFFHSFPFKPSSAEEALKYLRYSQADAAGWMNFPLFANILTHAKSHSPLEGDSDRVLRTDLTDYDEKKVNILASDTTDPNNSNSFPLAVDAPEFAPNLAVKEGNEDVVLNGQTYHATVYQFVTENGDPKGSLYNRKVTEFWLAPGVPYGVLKRHYELTFPNDPTFRKVTTDYELKEVDVKIQVKSKDIRCYRVETTAIGQDDDIDRIDECLSPEIPGAMVRISKMTYNGDKLTASSSAELVEYSLTERK